MSNILAEMMQALDELEKVKNAYYEKGGVDVVLITKFSPRIGLYARVQYKGVWYACMSHKTWLILSRDIPRYHQTEPRDWYLFSVAPGIQIIENDELGFEIWMWLFKYAKIKNEGANDGESLVSDGGAGEVAGCGEGEGGVGAGEGAVGSVPAGEGADGDGADRVVAGVVGTIQPGDRGGEGDGGGGGVCGEGEE